MRQRAGIGRSLDVYYRDTARTARMERLNEVMVPRGGLVFDIGAHLGDRTASFLRLGASVVALEPQPRVFRALRLIHGRSRRAVLLPWAAGAEEGETSLHLNTCNPTVSTLAPAFIAAAAGAPGWQDEVWGDSVTVPVTTLDALCECYGTPDFVKIDVEGHEAEVLQGLSVPLPALSFEFTTIQRPVAHACIDRLRDLGSYEFNMSLGEDHRLAHQGWVSAETMQALLEMVPDAANSGDVYARRMPGARRPD